MTEYIILWKKEQIGSIFKNGNNEYKFVPEKENFKEAIEKYALPKFFFTEEDMKWGDLPSIVKERVMLCSNLENNCSVLTDSLEIIKS